MEWIGWSVMNGGVKLEGLGSKEVSRSGVVLAVEDKAVMRRLFCKEAALLLGLADERGLGRGELVSPR